MQYQRALYLFRRDLRLCDNRALAAACATSQEVVPLFIVDPRQVTTANKYRSDHALTYMVESLVALSEEIVSQGSHLLLIPGTPIEALRSLITHLRFDAIFCTVDYTPFARTRDQEIAEFCSAHQIAFHQLHDLLLIGDPNTLRNKQGNPYQIFTPFWRAATGIPIPSVFHNQYDRLYRGSIPAFLRRSAQELITCANNTSLPVPGGTTAALQRLKKVVSYLANYATTKDIPSEETSFLSAPHKFGTISVRMTYHAVFAHFGPNHPLIRQLYWRDFFTYLAFHAPQVFGSAYRIRVSVHWKNDPKALNRWQEGETGIPLIDAGMRQLQETGFMHNRIRMIVASWLVKKLLIDWRFGELHFARLLVDYDPAVNNGNWQWCASTGADAMPFNRSFNPFLQQKKFDPQCLYVKTWVKELRTLSSQTIYERYRSDIVK